MDQSDIFKTKAFYKHTKDREKDHVIEKSNEIFPSGIYVAGKYSPIKYIDTPIRIGEIHTSLPSFVIEHTTNLYDCDTAVMKISDFLITPVTFTQYTIYELTANHDGPLLCIMNIEIIGKPKFVQYYQSTYASQTTPLLRLDNIEIQSNSDLITIIENLKIGDHFPETMVRINTITSSKFTIERS